MKYPKRSQYKYAKSRYRIGNWPENEAGLQMRGNLKVCLSEVLSTCWDRSGGWEDGDRRLSGHRGRTPFFEGTLPQQAVVR